MTDPRTRPPGIWVIIALQVVTAGLWMADLLLRTNLTGPSFQATLASSEVLRALILCWAGGVILASLLLARMSRRGWALMMVLVGVCLAANLAYWWIHPERAQWLAMATSVVVTFYLNSAAVRGRFLVRREMPRLTITEQPQA